MPHVFVSYVRENSGKVDEMARALEAEGVRVWLDRNDIRPGQQWKSAIRNAIRDGAYFLACFSDAYFLRKKTHINEELYLAKEELRLRSSDQAWFIPVLLSQCDVPELTPDEPSLRAFQAVSLYSDWSKGISQLVNAIYSDSRTRFEATMRPVVASGLNEEVVRRNLKAFVELRQNDQDPSSLLLNLELEFEVVNFKPVTAEYEQKFDEEAFEQADVMYMECVSPKSSAYRIDYPKPRIDGEYWRFRAQQTKITPIADGGSYIFRLRSEYRRPRPRSYSYQLVLGGTVLGMSAKVKCPDEFDCNVHMDEGGGHGRIWKSNATFLKGQHARFTWWPKSES